MCEFVGTKASASCFCAFLPRYNIKSLQFGYPELQKCEWNICPEALEMDFRIVMDAWDTDAYAGVCGFALCQQLTPWHMCST